MADFLETKRKEIADRLRELAPLVAEHERLSKAAAALAGVGDDGAGRAGRAPTRRGPGRPAGSGTRRRGRRRGTGTRGTQALDLVRARPGITIPELAEAMSIKQNYLYRVMPRLQSDKLVAKRGKGWHPTAGSAE